MKRFLASCLLALLFLANCQKKEEAKVQTPLPPGAVQAQNEITLLQGIVKQDPKNLSAWIELGNVLMDSSRFQEAINAYQMALELDPKNVDVMVDMGSCYRGIGRPDMAVAEYRKALAINPRHLYAHRNLGTVLSFDLGNKKQGIKELEEYLRLSPNTPDANKIRQELARLKAAK
jgi:tetratricopeptide (TPR) repeat protein